MLHRENGPTGDVFCVPFDDAKLFILSNFTIGKGTCIISPTNHGE
jgi:hypothetical protein